MKTVLFLCTGNYYRSRFAEIFFNWHAQQRKLAWRAESKGLALDARNPGPISRHTIARLQGHAIACQTFERFPCDVAADDFVRAHHVVAVKRAEHFPLMQSRFPQHLNRVEFWEVHDVDCSTPDESLPHLERQVLALVDQLAQQERVGVRRTA